MKLLPADLREQIPKLYSQEHVKLQEKMVYAKFFFPAAEWTWFVTEGEQEDGDYVFFGYVIGFESEWGYFVRHEARGWNERMIGNNR